MFEFFKDVLGFLNKEKIPYMLSGSVAMGIYIVPRATRDMDIVVELAVEDVDKFVAHFSKQYYCEKDAVLDAINRKSMFNVVDGKSGFKADFIILTSRKYRRIAFERRCTEDFIGMPIYVISPEDLVLSKIIWAQESESSQQITDLKNLLELQTLDRDYIRHWVKELDLTIFGLPL